jgi:hypothetical protein
MDDQPKKCNLFLCLSFVPYNIPLREVEGGISFRHLCGIGFLWAICLMIHFLPSLAEEAKKTYKKKEKKKGNLWPPLVSMVEEKFIKFRKEQIELGLAASCCTAIHLMHTIHHEKAIGGVTFAMFGLTSVRVK